MALDKLYLENFTVFDKMEIEFSSGINVFIGENGTGKTHMLKILYSFLESNTLMQNSKMLFFETLCKCFLSDNFKELFKSADKKLLTQISANNKQYIYQAEGSDNIPHKDELEVPFKNIEIKLQIDGQRSKEDSPTVFIPAKDMLTHSGLEKDYTERYIPFDKSLIDILNKSGVSELRSLSPESQDMLDSIKQIIGGSVLFEKNKYYILHENHKISFQYEAEGFKKLSVLWRLIETGILSKGAVLFWDEPEANINPQNIPMLTDMLFTLQKSGIQIFVATHNYVLAKYLELKKSNNNHIRFHSLYKSGGSIAVESTETFRDLKHNAIADAYNKLLDEVFNEKIGDR